MKLKNIFTHELPIKKKKRSIKVQLKHTSVLIQGLKYPPASYRFDIHNKIDLFAFTHVSVSFLKWNPVVDI